MNIDVHHSNMIDWLGTQAEKVASGDAQPFDSCVTDPPYHLASIVKRFGKPGSAEAKIGATGAYARALRGFMGKEWDGGDIAFRPETWRAVFDCLKPGAHLVAFSGTRTYHRMACAIEDAGFEIRDQLAWAYGSGFPKSHNMKDKYEGWGTALKPAWEPICFARKPLCGTVAANMLEHGTGAINIDACRVHSGSESLNGGRISSKAEGWDRPWKHDDEAIAACRARGADSIAKAEALGRWPANIIHDGSDEVLAAFPDSNGQQGVVSGLEPSSPFANVYGDMPNRAGSAIPRGDGGSAARFFYSAKAGPLDRIGSTHATVKPVDLMRWLTRLVTRPGGHVLDPFSGSGTTGIACIAEGFDCTMIELEAEHVADIIRNISFLRGEGSMSIVEHDRARGEPKSDDFGPLFAGDLL